MLPHPELVEDPISSALAATGPARVERLPGTVRDQAGHVAEVQLSR